MSKNAFTKWAEANGATWSGKHNNDWITLPESAGGRNPVKPWTDQI